MKKYFVFAFMAMVAAAAQAQIVSSRSSRVTTTERISDHPKGWNDIYVQYNMLKNGAYDDLDKASTPISSPACRFLNESMI